MVLGGPRCATTWCANWLTTETTLCLHDPLLEYTKRSLDMLTVPGKTVGISCTSTLLFPEWYLKHPARKIVLYRDPEEGNRSLELLGLPPVDIDAHNARVYAAVKGGVEIWHWDALFDAQLARTIWSSLLPSVPFDGFRHNELCSFNVQPHFRRLAVSKDAVAELVQRTKEVLI